MEYKNANVHTKKEKTTFRGTWHNSGHATEPPTEMSWRNKVESFLQVVGTRDHISPSPARYLPNQIEVSKFPVIKPSFRQRPLNVKIFIIIGLMYVLDIRLFNYPKRDQISPSPPRCDMQLRG